MKVKIEDVIPMCQYGNRHITVEADAGGLNDALNKMDALFRKYHNSMEKPKVVKPVSVDEAVYINNGTKWKKMQDSSFYYNEDTQTWIMHEYDSNIKGGRP